MVLPKQQGGSKPDFPEDLANCVLLSVRGSAPSMSSRSEPGL